MNLLNSMHQFQQWATVVKDLVDHSQLTQGKIFTITGHQGKANKTTQHHFIPVTIFITQNTKTWQMVVRLWREGYPNTLLVEMKIVTTIWKTLGWLFRKLKMELPSDPAIPLLGLCPKEVKSSKRYLLSHVYSSPIHNSKYMEST